MGSWLIFDAINLEKNQRGMTWKFLVLWSFLQRVAVVLHNSIIIDKVLISEQQNIDHAIWRGKK